MKYISNDMQTVLESKTLRIDSKRITESLHLTTVLLQIYCTDHCHYTLCILSQESDSQADFRMIDDITRDRTEAESIFSVIAAEGVTPCTLGDVLQDMIGII